MLIDLGGLVLLPEATHRLELLDADPCAEVRSRIGIPEQRDDVLATLPVHDSWDVVGRRLIFGERLTFQRTARSSTRRRESSDRADQRTGRRCVAAGQRAGL